MGIFKYVVIVIIIFLLLLSVVYFFLLFRLKNLKDKIYKYKEEKMLKDKNVLIVYQPTRHGTTKKIKDLVKEEILKRGYGVNIHTLTKSIEDYDSYQYTIFIIPVYFANINLEFINRVKSKKIKNLMIIYNGLNGESNKEDDLIKEVSLSKYNKIKLHTNDVENVVEFINKEVH